MTPEAEFFTQEEAIDYINLARNLDREAAGGSFLIEQDLFSRKYIVNFWKD
jgi:hypothetical protein